MLLRRELKLSYTLHFQGFETKASWLHVESSSCTQKRATDANSSSENATSAAQISGEMPSPSTNKATYALPETFNKLKTCSSLLVSLAMPVHVSHHNPTLAVAAHPWWEKASAPQQSVSSVRKRKILTSKTKPNANKGHQRRRAQAHQVKVTQKRMEAPRLAQQSGKGRTRFA